MVVVEAAAAGVPAIVVAGPDNAAVEHIEEGVNGFVADAAPETLADALWPPTNAAPGPARRRRRRPGRCECPGAQCGRLRCAGSSRPIRTRRDAQRWPRRGRPLPSRCRARRPGVCIQPCGGVPAPLALLLAVTAVLSLSWNLATAPLQGPDEADHVGYVEHLAETWEISLPSEGNGAYATDEATALGQASWTRYQNRLARPPCTARRRAPFRRLRGRAARQRARERQRPTRSARPAADRRLRGDRPQARVRRGLLRQASVACLLGGLMLLAMVGFTWLAAGEGRPRAASLPNGRRRHCRAAPHGPGFLSRHPSTPTSCSPLSGRRPAAGAAEQRAWVSAQRAPRGSRRVDRALGAQPRLAASRSFRRC